MLCCPLCPADISPASGGNLIVGDAEEEGQHAGGVVDGGGGFGFGEDGFEAVG